MGYAFRQNGGDYRGLFNNQHNDSLAAMQFLGNTSGGGTAAGFRGYMFQSPYIVEIGYNTGQAFVRGAVPALQCLSLFAAQTYDRTVFRAVERFGAVFSIATGFDGWGNSNSIRAALIPVGNWEDVL